MSGGSRGETPSQGGIIAASTSIGATWLRGEERSNRRTKPHCRNRFSRLAVVDPFLRPLVHDRLIADGRKAKAARTAVMPKRVVLANTVVRETRSWKPNHA